MSKEYMNDGSLSEKWKYRFNFYDQHGFPGFWGATPEYKAAFKALKSKTTINYSNEFHCFLLFLDLFICSGLMEKSNYSSITWHSISICWCINWR